MHAKCKAQSQLTTPTHALPEEPRFCLLHNAVLNVLCKICMRKSAYVQSVTIFCARVINASLKYYDKL